MWIGAGMLVQTEEHVSSKRWSVVLDTVDTRPCWIELHCFVGGP